MNLFSFALSPELFAQAFPFHILLNQDLTIAQTGDSLTKVVPSLVPGSSFAKHFAFVRPCITSLSFEEVARHEGAVVVLEICNTSLRLRGNWVLQEEKICFLGGPCIQSPQELKEAGLSMLDLARHDATPDLMVALQTQKTALEDARKLTQRLKKKRAVLKAAKEEAEDARERAEASNRAKSAFLANMSHEIRTPMTAIIGYTEILEEPEISPAQKSEYIRIVRRNGKHLLSIINDILDFSRIESGHLDVEHVQFDLREVVEDVVSLMTLKAREKGLDCELHPPHPDVPGWIFSDPVRIKQILTNLVGNAIKFTASGSVSIALEFEPQESGGKISFSIRDTGIGIQKDQVEALFQAFSQADESMTRRFGGTGLGLAITQRLAQLLGGEILVESEPGKGSCFTVSVTTTQARGSFSRLARATGKTPSTDGKKRQGRLLIVDDGEDNRRLLSFVLSRMGFEVELANNGAEALQKVQASGERPFDLVLMDLQMPVMNGLEATSELRNMGFTKPILALTADDTDERREQSQNAGCNAFASKPIRPKQLSAYLDQWLESLPEQPAVQKRSRVLVVDDCEDNRRLLSFFFKKEGVKIVTADNGREALSLIRDESSKGTFFDLVLMDVHMPSLDGLTTTKVLRASGYEKPILALTANDSASAKQEILEAGFDGLLDKPFSRDQVQHALQKWCSAPES